jgi:hypothetical protein
MGRRRKKNKTNKKINRKKISPIAPREPNVSDSPMFWMTFSLVLIFLFLFWLAGPFRQF